MHIGQLYFDLLLLFFNDTATTEIYTLSLHDALPIYRDRNASPDGGHRRALEPFSRLTRLESEGRYALQDRKSTRLNSTHDQISYAVFCLKKKKTQKTH